MKYRIIDTLIELFLKLIIPVLYGLIIIVYITELNMPLWLICSLLVLWISYTIFSIFLFIKELKLIWRKKSDENNN